MRLLITGGAGCLGASLVERYIARGSKVLVVDNFATGAREALPAHGALTVVEGSVADGELVERCFRQFAPTHVIHSAASYKDPGDWLEDATTNVVGTINVIQAARRAEVKRFVNFQTALCYGRPASSPIPADHPSAPFTSYAISKTAGEQYLALSDLPYVSLRLANVTGPRLAIGPIPTFYKRLKAKLPCHCSTAVRDFMDMEDFLALVDLVLREDAPLGVFNASTGEGHSIREVFDAVRRHLGLEDAPDPEIVPPGTDDVPTFVLDSSETTKAFGWTATVAFEDSIARMLDWYDLHGITDIYSHLTPKS